VLTAALLLLLLLLLLLPPPGGASDEAVRGDRCAGSSSRPAARAAAVARHTRSTRCPSCCWRCR
jgi:hypothetical protein